MKLQSFVNSPKKIKEIIKMFLHFWFFTCCPHPFSLRTSLFTKRPYVSLYSYFHYVLTCWIWKTYLNIYVKNKKNMLILKFHPGMKSLHLFFSFFSFREEISSLSFIPRWNFISAETCKQEEIFHHTQGWFHPRTSFIPGWIFTCKHPLIYWLL